MEIADTIFYLGININLKENENRRILMDTNFVEDFYGEPLPLVQKIYTLFL